LTHGFDESSELAFDKLSSSTTEEDFSLVRLLVVKRVPIDSNLNSKSESSFSFGELLGQVERERSFRHCDMTIKTDEKQDQRE